MRCTAALLVISLIGAGWCARGVRAENEKNSATTAEDRGTRLSPEEKTAKVVEHWEISFEDELELDEYAQRIDSLKIEIAAVSKNGKIEYITGVTKRKPDKRIGTRESDYRLYIPWKKGNLHAFDRKLLAKAGINSDKKELLHFFPAGAHAQLAELEQAFAGRDPITIKRTRFGVREKEKTVGYEFYVIEQDPPKLTQPPAQAPPESRSRNRPSRD